MAQLNLPPPPTGDDPKGVQFRDWFYKLSQFLKNNVFGTVTSVDVSGGTTGLTTSGGPITSSGTITIAGTLDYTNGGTGLTALGTAGQVLTVNAGATALEYTTNGAGTVTSVTSANADITVATSTTTPVLTLVQAPALRSATTTINVSSATAPTSGQVLTATSDTAATWQSPSGGGTTFYNVLPNDVTIAADTSYVLVGYLDLNGFNLTVDGNLGIF